MNIKISHNENILLLKLIASHLLHDTVLVSLLLTPPHSQPLVCDRMFGFTIKHKVKKNLTLLLKQSKTLNLTLKCEDGIGPKIVVMTSQVMYETKIPKIKIKRRSRKKIVVNRGANLCKYM